MYFKSLVETIEAIPLTQSVLLLGPPGAAKTSCAKEIGARMGDDSIIEVVDLCSRLPEDLLGLPFREGGVTEYAPPVWLKRLSKPGVKGVLLLDDLAAAPPAVQVAAFRIILERKSGDVELSDGVRIIATANRKEDKSGASTLPAALRNRVVIFELEISNDEWCTWATKAGVDNAVVSFIRHKPSYLFSYPKDADAKGSFATPRSTAMAGFAVAEINKRRDSLGEERRMDAIRATTSGLLGEGKAIELAAFIKVRDEMKDPREVLDDPEKALPKVPNEPDRLVAIICGISEVAGQRNKDPLVKDKVHAAKQFVRALAYLTKREAEFGQMGLAAYQDNGGTPMTLLNALATAGNDPRVASMRAFIKAAFSEDSSRIATANMKKSSDSN